MLPLLATTLALALQSPATDAPGRRVDLGDEAILFLPQGYRPADGIVNVVLHLHGAPSVIEPAIVKVGWPAVLVEFNRKGLSSVYRKPFEDRALFPRLLAKTFAAVREAGLAEDPREGWVLVSSFSAGFGGVRELLKVPEHFDRIDALVLADSLYAGYDGDSKERKVSPENMKDFRRFAQAAAEGKKWLLVTHTELVPDGYASTRETADDLIAIVAGWAEPYAEDWGPRLKTTRRFERGLARIVGFSGATGEDHMAHLRGIDRIWSRMPGWPQQP